MGTAGVSLDQIVAIAKDRAEKAGVFQSVQPQDGGLVCQAQGSAEEAHYRLMPRDGGLVVSLDMADRWQSESIESTLMHTGDKLEELLDEELAELGYEGDEPTYRHFRNDAMLFVFETPVPIEGLDTEQAGERASQFLLGYEACFRQLGDMDAEGDED
ncbi:MAG: hypothetical protein ACIARQ_02590 [Phycisphaerales bacterium JB061]|jgi:hypothetical protein